MPRPRFDKADPKKKRKLLDAAIAEFAAHGYELASVNRILDASGFSKGSFYYYFDDKPDLAAAAFLEAAGPVLDAEELRPPKSAHDFWVELRKTSMRQLRLMESKRVPYECMVRLSAAMLKEPQLAAHVMPLFAPRRQQMNEFLQRGVKVGALRSDIPLATLTAIIEAMKSAAYSSTFHGDRVPSDAEMDAFADLTIDLAKRVASPKKGSSR